MSLFVLFVLHNKVAAIEGGTVAGNARRELVWKSGSRVSSRENCKEIPKAVKKKQVKSTTDKDE